MTRILWDKSLDGITYWVEKGESPRAPVRCVFLAGPEGSPDEMALGQRDALASVLTGLPMAEVAALPYEFQKFNAD